jgi:transcriptional regulator with XRE-family HTH domain
MRHGSFMNETHYNPGDETEHKQIARACGERLRGIMKVKDWKEADVARIMGGIHPTGVGKYVNGEQIPKIENVIKVCHEANVTLDWFFLGRKVMPKVNRSQTYDDFLSDHRKSSANLAKLRKEAAVNRAA